MSWYICIGLKSVEFYCQSLRIPTLQNKTIYGAVYACMHSQNFVVVDKIRQTEFPPIGNQFTKFCNAELRGM